VDEPYWALNPIAIYKLKKRVESLKERYTIVSVTHNMPQVSRVSDYTAFFLAGNERVDEQVEYGPTERLFTDPQGPRTEAYVTGRFG
jgi:phosphate transport system ATP-binding protein